MARSLRHSISLATAVAGFAAALGMPPGASAAFALNLDPPPLVMVSEAGYHVADQGSFCVDASRRRFGVRVCADVVELDVTRLSVVKPGDTIAISLSKARVLLRSRLCGRSRRCEAVVSVAALGCDEPLRSFWLKAGRTSWTVPLDPGAYQLDVFVRRFNARDGRTGHTSGAFGLLVDPAADRGIVPVSDDLLACGT
jgi:hypothetical protein